MYSTVLVTYFRPLSFVKVVIIKTVYKFMVGDAIGKISVCGPLMETAVSDVQ